MWRDGGRTRIEESDGVVSLIVGDQACWRFDRGHETPVLSPSTAVRYAGSGTQLLTRREPVTFAGDDFTRPTGPVDAAGLQRHVAAVVPTFAVAALLVASSHYVGLVPQRLAEQYGDTLGMCWLRETISEAF